MSGAENRHRTTLSVIESPEKLPDGLRKELAEIRGSDVLCGKDADLDGALADAVRDCEDLGERLMVHVFRHIGEAARARDEGEDPTGAYFRAARVCEATLRAGVAEHEGENARERLVIARCGLSASLLALGDLSKNDADSVRLFARAVEVGEEAAGSVSEQDAPHVWAAAQRGLADALCKQGLFLDDEKISRPLYERAVEAGEAAKRVLRRRDGRDEWADFQKCLATSYLELALIVGGDESHDMLERSARAFKIALRHMRRRNDPQKYARTLESLGLAHMKRGELLMEADCGKKARRHFGRAANVFERAINSEPRENDPMRWARNHTRVGSCCRARAGLSSWPIALVFLSRAFASYEASLKVYSPEDSPWEWAMYHERLGTCLVDMANHCDDSTARRLFSRALDAYEGAMKSINSRNAPQLWAMIQTSMSLAHRWIGARCPDYEAMRHLRRSMEIIEGARMVFDRMGSTAFERCLTRHFIGSLLGDMADHANNNEEAIEYLERGVRACEEGVQICKGSKADDQLTHVMKTLKYLRMRLQRLKSI